VHPVEHYVYLEDQAGASFIALSEHREMGAALTLRRREFAALRKWRIREFDNFRISNEPRADGVSIVRVLHATQDWWQLLGVGGP